MNYIYKLGILLNKNTRRANNKRRKINTQSNIFKFKY